MRWNQPPRPRLSGATLAVWLVAKLAPRLVLYAPPCKEEECIPLCGAERGWGSEFV